MKGTPIYSIRLIYYKMGAKVTQMKEAHGKGHLVRQGGRQASGWWARPSMGAPG